MEILNYLLELNGITGILAGAGLFYFILEPILRKLPRAKYK